MNVASSKPELSLDSLLNEMFFISFFDPLFSFSVKRITCIIIGTSVSNEKISLKRMFTSIKTNFFNRLSLVFIYLPYFCSVNSTDIEKILISIDNK